MAKKKARSKKAPRKKKADSRGVRLRTGRREEIFVPGGPELQRAALAWSYTVRNRLRWRKRHESRLAMADRARETLESLGVTPDQLALIAERGVVEVSAPCMETAWEGRVLPWEYVLNAATRAERGQDRRLQVVRHLQVSRDPSQAVRFSRAAFVLSAPEMLTDRYDFSVERELTRRLIGEKGKLTSYDNPSPDALRAGLKKVKPHLVHVAGFDTHQAGELLGYESERVRHDGLFFGDTKEPRALNAEAVGDVLGACRPRLVTFNIHHSGARTAAMTVASGAAAAIGFADDFDDSAAELFYADLYGLLSKKTDVHEAFFLALELLGSYDVQLHGSGIILWSATSLFATAVRSEASTRARRRSRELREERSTVLGSPDAAAAQKTLHVKLEPVKEINVSLLHNRRPVFEYFWLKKDVDGLANDISIDVELHVGNERPRYRCNTSLSTREKDIAGQIIIPLTWVKDEQILESERSSLYVRVLWGEHEVYAETHPVTLLPADEWVDSDRDRQWLPSFVQPRDPGVQEIIERAQAVLLGLSGEVAQGFDGYQSIESVPIEPEIEPDEIIEVEEAEPEDEVAVEDASDEEVPEEVAEYEELTDGVDRQVEAIWSAISTDITLGYINPPPTYSEASQRLRMPSDILRQGRGTCIDLSLLLASCFEWVEIFPAIILLEGHAFPAYWRSETAHDEFWEVAYGAMREAPRTGLDEERAGLVEQTYTWVLHGEQGYEEVQEHVRVGNLVPIEATMLASRSRFEDAIEEGWENLRNRDEFNSIIDVVIARHEDVTPLPMRRKQP